MAAKRKKTEDFKEDSLLDMNFTHTPMMTPQSDPFSMPSFTFGTGTSSNAAAPMNLSAALQDPFLGLPEESSQWRNWLDNLVSDDDNLFVSNLTSALPPEESITPTATVDSSVNQVHISVDVLLSTAQFENKIMTLYEDQKVAVLPFSPIDYARLRDAHGELQILLQYHEQQITALINSRMLMPPTMKKALDVQRDLTTISRKSLALCAELENLQKDVASMPTVNLLILTQPFPTTILKEKIPKEPINVEIFCGSKCSLSSKPTVRAYYTDNTVQKTSKRKPDGIINAEAHVIPSKYSSKASFDKISFTQGSNKEMKTVSFTAGVTVHDHYNRAIELTLWSDPSAPLIVMTNENQWAESESILLMERAFGTLEEITWERLANFLHLFYLDATLQTTSALSRVLNCYDMHYLKGRIKIKPNGMIARQDAEEFFNWLCPIFYRLKHSKQFVEMWKQGYVLGFMSRNGADNELMKPEWPLGTCLLRFSEKELKKTDRFGIVISYKSDAEGRIQVRHCLPKDKRSIADYLGDEGALRTLLLTGYDLKAHEPSEGKVLQVCNKGAAIQRFCTTKEISMEYDEHIVMGH